MTRLLVIAMKKLLLFLLLTGTLFGADAANDLLFMQRNAANDDNEQKNVTALAGAFLGFDTAGDPQPTRYAIATAVRTWLATPSSANLVLAVTGETGTGALVFADSPVLVTPTLGTPLSGTATNLSGTAAGLTAGAATILATARNINGVSFDGSANITVTAAGSTLSDTVTVAKGGTGATTLTGSLIGNGTSAVTAATSSTVGQVYRVTGANTFAFGAVDLADTDAVTGVLPAANQAGVIKIAVFSVDGGGAAIATGTVAGTARIPFACTLTGYSISATAATGTNTIKIWLKATATSIPTIADVINTSGVSLTTGTAVASATLSDFTDTVYAAGDMARCAVTAVDGAATDLTVTLYGTRL